MDVSLRQNRSWMSRTGHRPPGAAAIACRSLRSPLTIHRQLDSLQSGWQGGLNAIRSNETAPLYYALRREFEAAGLKLVADGNFWRPPRGCARLLDPTAERDEFVLKFQKPI